MQASVIGEALPGALVSSICVATLPSRSGVPVLQPTDIADPGSQLSGWVPVQHIGKLLDELISQNRL